MKWILRYVLRALLSQYTKWLSFLIVLWMGASNPDFETMFKTNLKIQLGIFTIFAALPALRTNRMSYVDIAWPWGLVAIGVQMLHVNWPQMLGRVHDAKVLLLSGFYCVMGVRMGIGALVAWWKGHLQTELPRYQYQRIRWSRRKAQPPQQQATTFRWEMLKDIYIQALANCTYLFYPAIIVVFDPVYQSYLHPIEWVGVLWWGLSLVLETAADVQKMQFLRQQRRLREETSTAVCDVGLWKYSRHPNYFFEWNCWNGIAVFASHSVWKSLDDRTAAFNLGVLFMTSYTMYYCLKYYTGCKPAEHFSLQHRPKYAEYIKNTNQFFPGIPKNEPIEH